MFLRTVASAVLLSSVLILSISGASAAVTRKVCFYVDSPSTPFNSGHVSLQLLDTNIQNSASQVYGFYPSSSGSVFGGAGQIRSDAKHSWDWKICYSVTLAQYNALVTYVTDEIKSPPSYDLLSTNCVNWAASAPTPFPLPGYTNRLGIPDPNALQITFAAAGNGGTIGAGTVVKNIGGITPDNSSDPPATYPDSCSYEGILSLSLQNPAAMASAQNLTLYSNSSKPVYIGTGGNLTARVSGANPSNSVMFIRWGDQTNTTQAFTGYYDYSADHTYNASGLFAARLLILNSASLEGYDLPVNVTMGPSNSTSLRFQAPPTMGTNYQYLITPPSPPVAESPGTPIGLGSLVTSAVLVSLVAWIITSRRSPRR